MRKILFVGALAALAVLATIATTVNYSDASHIRHIYIDIYPTPIWWDYSINKTWKPIWLPSQDTVTIYTGSGDRLVLYLRARNCTTVKLELGMSVFYLTPPFNSTNVPHVTVVNSTTLKIETTATSFEALCQYGQYYINPAMDIYIP